MAVAVPLIRHLLCILALMAPAVTAAQSVPPRDSEQFCFRGRPLPECNRFLLLEVGASGLVLTNHRFPDSAVPADGGNIGTFAIGLMTNRRNRTALGAALELGGGEYPRRRFAIEGRGRKWLTNRAAFDVGAGPLMIHSSSTSQASDDSYAFGATSHVGLVFGDLLTATAGLDFVHGPRNQATVTAGGRLGSWASASALALGTLALVTFIATGGPRT